MYSFLAKGFVLLEDLSVDLRDAVGDRLFLSKGFRRDGVSFITYNFLTVAN